MRQNAVRPFAHTLASSLRPGKAPDILAHGPCGPCLGFRGRRKCCIPGPRTSHLHSRRRGHGQRPRQSQPGSFPFKPHTPPTRRPSRAPQGGVTRSATGTRVPRRQPGDRYRAGPGDLARPPREPLAKLSGTLAGPLGRHLGARVAAISVPSLSLASRSAPSLELHGNALSPLAANGLHAIAGALPLAVGSGLPDLTALRGPSIQAPAAAT
jgi:hypothetical protein